MKITAYDEAEAFATVPAQRTSNMISSMLGQILVVDDEVELKNALVEMLNAQGYNALGCTSGTEALSALHKQNFDVLLSDLMMPEMDGVALLRTALKIDQHLVCIIMTGQGTIQTAVEAMKFGAFDYVLKPFRLQALLPVLTRAINLRRLNQENLQLRETVAIHELCQTIAFTLDPKTVLSKLADAAQQQSEADEVSILLPTDNGSELYVAAVRGENRERLLGERIPFEQGISSWVARERQPLLLKGEVNDVRFTALWPRSDISSAISVPLQAAGKLVGIININTVSSPRPFTLGQMKALTILASTAAAALESASLYRQVRQAEEKYRSIFDNAVEGIFQSTPEGRFITVNPSLARILGYDSPEEVIETITDIAHQLYVDPESRAEAARLQEEQGILRDFEFEAYRKDGEKIWLSANRRTLLNEFGTELYREGTLEDITERKRIEEALRKSEDRYRDIVEHSHDLICTHDLEGQILSVNQTAAKALGYERDTLLGLNIREALLAEFSDEFDDYIAELRKEGIAHGLMAVQTRAGEKRVWEYTNTLRTEGVAVPIVRGMAHDVTEQRRAEAELRKSEAQYRRLLDTTYEGVMVFDAEMQITYVNHRLAEMLGVSATEMIGNSALSFVTNSSRGDVEQQWQHRAKGIKAQYDLRLRRKDGSDLWVIVCATPIVGEHGGFIGSLSMLTDITERKQGEVLLRESEEKYRSIVETANEGIWLVDNEACTSFVNQQMAAMLGYTVAEMLGRPAFDFIFPADAAFVEQKIAQRQQGTSDTNEFRLRRKDGSAIVTLYNASPTKNQAGEVVGSLSMVIDITERKRAEEALRESEARFQSAFEHAPIGIALIAPDGRIVQVNHSFCEILGYTKEELLASDVLVITHKDDIVATIQHIRRLISGKVKTSQHERRFLHKLGHEVLALTNLSLMRDAENKPLYVIAQIQDITERKRAEEALGESEVRYRLLFESNPLPMWVYDLETLGFLAVNEAAIQHYGYSLKEFQGMTVRDIRPPEDIPALLENISRIGETRNEAGVWKHRKKDGTLIDVEITSHPFTFAGRASELVLAHDVTERKQVEEALQREKEHTEHIISVAPTLIAGMAPDGATTFINSAVTRVTGYEPEEIVGKNWWRINYPEAEYEQVDRLFEEFEQGRAVANYEMTLTTKSGSKRTVSWNSANRSNERGEIIEIIGIGADITDSRELEEQLRQSQKLEAVGQLAGGVAHDFNNLLTVITGYSDLSLRRLDKDNPLRSNLEEIKKAGERAASLTRQLLAFSRKQVLQPKVLQLNAIVADVDKMLRRLIGEDIDTLTVLEPGLGQIKADPGQIEQVILNLAVNARDAMPQGGKLTIETSNVYLDNQYARQHTAIQPGHYVMLAVSDTGCGIDAETQVRMFEPFFTTKEQGKGTGLGLSTVYGIVKQSGGHLWVYSEMGKGTAFKIYLPQVDGVTERDEARDALAGLPQGQETVLLTEDEEQVRQMIRMILEMNGYHVLEAVSGEEALTLYKEHEGQIDLIMTDVVMPRMSGRELAQSLEVLHPGIKVLYMSGYTDDAIVRHGLLDQEIVFLQKPFTPDALMRKVREVLDAPHDN
jgi:two-component system cell cycle sensor histidine kinase/response regulator CckA